jgi:HEAT repeat protein
VVRESGDEDQRAMAAALLGYAPNKAAVATDLEYAMQDSEEPVRANALRALSAIAVLARLQPGLGIHVSPTWFIELLNSITLSDRTRAATALVSLTDQDAAAALSQIRSRALDSVVEMARWNDLPRALPAFILTGRMAGLEEQQIQAAWTSGDRKAVIDQALHPGRKKKTA